MNAPNQIAAQFSQIWTAYQQAIQQHVDCLRSLSKQEMALMPAEEYMLAFRVDDYEFYKQQEKVARGIKGRLICYAESVFGTAGRKVNIEREDLEPFIAVDSENHQVTFNPLLLWNHLESKYGGNKGKEIAYSQAAAKLVNVFGLARENAIQTKGQFTILNLHVYIDDFDKKYSGKTNLSNSSMDSVKKVFNELACFSEWAELSLMADQCRAAEDHWWKCKAITSREQYSLGTCSYVTYSCRFEFRLTQDVVEQLQIFVSTYAADQFKKAA